MKKALFTLVSLALIAFVIYYYTNPKTRSRVVQGVHFGSGKNCEQRGICNISDAEINVEAEFKLIRPDVMTITFNIKQLMNKQPLQAKEFLKRKYYVFDHSWVAPSQINNALQPIKPIVVKPGFAYLISISGNNYTLTIPLLQSSFGTTVKFGNGSMCANKGMCSAASPDAMIISTFEYDSSANLLSLSFSLDSVKKYQPEKARDFSGPFYVFDSTWKAPDTFNVVLKPRSPIIVTPMMQNPITNPDPNNPDSLCISFDLNPPPAGTAPTGR